MCMSLDKEIHRRILMFPPQVVHGITTPVFTTSKESSWWQSSQSLNRSCLREGGTFYTNSMGPGSAGEMFEFLRMLDSYDSAIIPLGSDAVLRDRSRRLYFTFIAQRQTDRQTGLKKSIISQKNLTFLAWCLTFPSLKMSLAYKAPTRALYVTMCSLYVHLLNVFFFTQSFATTMS